ncbi:hypothetical protein HMPREF1168_01718 [Aeromonas veronii AMC34]|uniref:Transposase DDE domain-containing protein n=1 Tax=Aeromonas veronii AMC34 TaxID=1073383 RepID=K1J3Q5_AERVE|nr:hypothetical protein HMPREF1168_01718 [Aeromonas veronii AMC34]
MPKPWITGFYQNHYEGRGRNPLYTDQTICTFLMLKGIFNLTVQATLTAYPSDERTALCP